MNETSINNSLDVDWVLNIAKQLHENGLPAHRLEESLEGLCLKLNLKGEFFTTPGSIFASITSKDGNQSHMIKVNQSELNLEKIDAIEKLINQPFQGGKITPSEHQRLEEICAMKERYSNPLMVLFFALSTGSAACVFGGNLPEILCAFTIGAGIGGLNIGISKVPQLNKITVIIAAFWAVCLSTLFNYYFIDFHQDIATICGLIIVIPGFSFTVSITEMVNNHLVAGISRFAQACITFSMIAIGIAVGIKWMNHMPEATQSYQWMKLPFWKEWIALIFVPLGFVVLFKAKPKDFIWILIACWCSYYTHQFAQKFVSPPVAVFIASFGLGIVSNSFSRIMNKNASTMLIPGMIILVPGSLGFFSITHLINSHIIAGLETALSMVTTTMALVFGIIASTILISTKR